MFLLEKEGGLWYNYFMKRFSIWNFYARAYDVINENIPYLKMLDGIIKEARINGGLQILDAGCGTGNLLKKMSQTSFNGKFIGIDSSEEMLNRAKKKFLSNPGVALHHADLDKRLDFADGSFDRIVSSNALYALREPQKMIAEFYRLLKSRGRLVITNPHDTSTFSGIMKKQYQELGLIKFLIRFIFNLPSLAIIIFVNVFFLKKNKNYWSQEQAERILKNSGFRDIIVRLTYADQALLVSAIKP